MNVLFDRIKENATVNDGSQKIVLSESPLAGYREAGDVGGFINATDTIDVLVELTSDTTHWTILNDAQIAYGSAHWEISYAGVTTPVGYAMSSYGSDPVIVSWVLTANAMQKQVRRKVPALEISNGGYLSDSHSGQTLVYTGGSGAAMLLVDTINDVAPKVGFQTQVIAMGTGNVGIQLANSAYGKLNGGTSSITTSARWQHMLVSCPLVDYELVVKIV